MKRTINVKDKRNDSNLIEKLNNNFNINKCTEPENDTIIPLELDLRDNMMELNNPVKDDEGPTEEEVRMYVCDRRRSIKESQEGPMEDTVASRTAVAQNEIDDNDIRVSKKYVEDILLPIKKELQSIKEIYEKKKIEAWNNITTPVKKDGYAIASTNKATEKAIEKVKEHFGKYEYVNHPSHYNSSSIETIEKMRRIWGDEQTAVWCEMTAFKYRDRIGNKPDNSTEQEVGKIKWYEDKARELRNK